MKKILSPGCLLLLMSLKLFSAPIDLLSPDKRIKVTIDLKNKISYAVTFDGSALIEDSDLQLNLDNQKMGENPHLVKKVFSTVNTSSNPVVPFKFSTVMNHYNLLRLDFKGNFSVEFRAYNDGMAYRFITDKKDSLIVTGEDGHFNFTHSVAASYLQTNTFQTSYEILYARKDLNHIDRSKMSVLPILFDTKRYKVLLSDADLDDYPAMFVKVSGDKSVDALFPNNPVEYAPRDDKGLKIIKESPYIAKTAGTRSFPWRFLLITDKFCIQPPYPLHHHGRRMGKKPARPLPF